MDRRSFLFGLCGAGVTIAGMSAAGSLLVQPAEATPLDQLKNMARPEDATEEIDDLAGETPDGTPIEEAQARRRQARRSYRRGYRHGRRNNRRYWRGGRYARRGRYWNNGRWWVGRRRVCRTYWNRWGRPYSRCWWRYW